MRLLINLFLSEDGVAAVEYIAMLTLIIFVMLISISALGNTAQAVWLTINQSLGTAW